MKYREKYVIIALGVYTQYIMKEVFYLKHIKTINKADLKASAEKGGCGKCQSSCQSACKTSCGVANQQCENKKK